VYQHGRDRVQTRTSGRRCRAKYPCHEGCPTAFHSVEPRLVALGDECIETAEGRGHVPLGHLGEAERLIAPGSQHVSELPNGKSGRSRFDICRKLYSKAKRLPDIGDRAWGVIIDAPTAVHGQQQCVRMRPSVVGIPNDGKLQASLACELPERRNRNHVRHAHVSFLHARYVHGHPFAR